MQTDKHHDWQDFRAQLIYAVTGLSALSLLVTWSLEQVAATFVLQG